MRNVFICLSLGAVIWWVQSGSSPLTEPLVFLGFLVVLPLMCMRAAERTGLPPHIGALVAGAIVGPTGLVSGWALELVRPFTDLAAAWVGLYLGSTLMPGRVFERRSFVAALTAVVGPALTTFAVMAALGLSPAFALRVGLLAAVSAPFLSFLCPSGRRRDLLSLNLLVSGLSLLPFIVLCAVQDGSLSIEALSRVGFDILCWAVAVELIQHTARRVKTDPGHYVLIVAVALLVLLACQARGLSPLLVSLATGAALALRSGRNRAHVHALDGGTKLLGALVVADFAARLDPVGAIRLAPGHWAFLLAYGASMGVGKTVGVALGSRLRADALRHWLDLLPQGILASLFLSRALPPQHPLLQLSPGTMEAGLILLCGVGMPILLIPARRLLERIQMRRFQKASLR